MIDHDRIWLEPEPASDPDYGRQWVQHNVWPDGVEYVRADLFQKLERDRQDRIDQCNRMANDWAEFCEAMGVRWDTQEAVAAELKAKASATAIRIRDLEERLAKAAVALEQIADLTARCEHDGGFDREIGPIGCNLGDKCLCIGLHPIARTALSQIRSEK